VDLDGRLRRFLEEIRPGEPGLALAVTRGDRMVWQGCAGLADLATGTPIDPDTRFHVVSLSKTYTAAVTVALAASGAPSLDDEVARHVRELPAHAAAITLRHLLSMTSGLRDAVEIERLRGVWDPSPSRLRDIFDLACRQRTVNAPPGTQYGYANVNFVLLEEALARATGQPAETLRQRLLYEPLGLTRTCARPHLGVVLPGLATPYARDGDGRWTQTTDLLGIAADQVTTTLHDLGRWLSALCRGTIGGVSVTATMAQRTRLGDGRAIHYGLGLAVRRYRGLTVLCHTGTQPGYKAHIAWLPERDVGIAILSNRDDTQPTRLAASMMEAICEPDFPDAHPAAGAAARLARSPLAGIDPEAVAGTYVGRSTGEWMALQIDDDGVLRGETLGDPIAAYADGDGAFRDADDYVAVAPVELRLQIESGRVSGCDVDLGGQRWRARREPTPAVTPADLAAYVGRYESAEMASRHEVTLGADGLVIHYGPGVDGGRAFAMTPIAPDIFLVRPRAAGVVHRHVFVFERDGAGDVVAARVTMERLKAVRIARVA
jgi:CubicO group peptidase (beta-lactamase class C family)